MVSPSTMGAQSIVASRPRFHHGSKQRQQDVWHSHHWKCLSRLEHQWKKGLRVVTYLHIKMDRSGIQTLKTTIEQDTLFSAAGTLAAGPYYPYVG